MEIESTPHTRIVVIVAGTNEPSNSNILADTFAEGSAENGGIHITKFRLKDLQIKHFTLERYARYCDDKDDDFCKIESALADAHAVVIATPIWNFSVPAHLKNLIDRMGAFALDQETHSKGQLKGKPFYIIFTGGAPKIAWETLMYVTTLHITEAIKYYGGTVIGRYFEPKSLVSRGNFGMVVDKRPQTLDAVRKQGSKFGLIAKQYAQNGSLSLSTRFGHTFFSFLYRMGNRMLYPISKLQ